MLKGTFARWQPIYADYGIPTFPLNPDSKIPAVHNWPRIGLPGSEKLAERFRDADMFGFLCGPRNHVTVLDCDTRDENVLADALARHGRTQVIARTASGKFHAYYRHNGERRRIRPWRERGLPIDVLGTNGLVVAMPSKYRAGCYAFVEGNLDEFDRLPVMRGLEDQFYTHPPQIDSRSPLPRRDLDDASIFEGARGKQLFDHCMRRAHSCGTQEQLLAEARAFNLRCVPPVEEKQIMNTVESVWKYTDQGLNRFGQHGAWLSTADIHYFVKHRLHVEHILLSYLLAQNGPSAEFMITNSLAVVLGFDRERLARARAALIELGYIEVVRPAWAKRPAIYRWRHRRAQEQRRRTVD